MGASPPVFGEYWICHCGHPLALQGKEINLLEQAFEQITDEQLAKFRLKTGKHRMDSTQIASNIRQHGRLQLLVEVLQRVPRMLSEADQARYVELLKPFTQGHPGWYVYQTKLSEFPDQFGGWAW